MMADYRERRDLVVGMFKEAPWIAMHSPASGPYLWGDISAITMDSIGFSEDLLERQRVALMPGEALGVPGFIRLGYISDDVDTLVDGVRRIIGFGNNFQGAAGR
jgi:aspartate aminotransferase